MTHYKCSKCGNYIVSGQCFKCRAMERNIHTQFPNFDDKEGFNKLLNELDKHGFEDECWHNEAMPHVSKLMPTKEHPDREMRVWIDFKDNKKSDLFYDLKDGEPYYRFLVDIVGEYGDGDTTDLQEQFLTWMEAVDFTNNYLDGNIFKVEWKEGYPDCDPQCKHLDDFESDEWNLKSYGYSFEDIEDLGIGQSLDIIGVTDRIVITRMGEKQ